MNAESEPITVLADKVLSTFQSVTVTGPLSERFSEKMSVSQPENNEEVGVVPQRTT